MCLHFLIFWDIKKYKKIRKKKEKKFEFILAMVLGNGTLEWNLISLQSLKV